MVAVAVPLASAGAVNGAGADTVTPAGALADQVTPSAWSVMFCAPTVIFMLSPGLTTTPPAGSAASGSVNGTAGTCPRVRNWISGSAVVAVPLLAVTWIR